MPTPLLYQPLNEEEAPQPGGVVGRDVTLVVRMPIGTHKNTNMLKIHRLGQKFTHVRKGGNR